MYCPFGYCYAGAIYRFFIKMTQINKYQSKEIQNEKAILEFFLLKVGEIRFQISEVDRHVNGRGCMIVALAMEFKELDELLSQAEDKLIQVRNRFLDGNTISIKK